MEFAPTTNSWMDSKLASALSLKRAVCASTILLKVARVSTKKYVREMLKLSTTNAISNWLTKRKVNLLVLSKKRTHLNRVILKEDASNDDRKSLVTFATGFSVQSLCKLTQAKIL